MSKDKGTTDLTGSEQKIKIDSSSSTNAAHHQTPQQQPDDVMRMSYRS